MYSIRTYVIVEQKKKKKNVEKKNVEIKVYALQIGHYTRVI